MYAATGGPNVKWEGTDFKWGAGTTGPQLATALTTALLKNQIHYEKCNLQ